MTFPANLAGNSGADKRYRGIVASCIAIAALLAVAALTGWAIGNAALVSIVPRMPGMSVPTASSFLLCAASLGVLAAPNGQRRLPLVRLITFVVALLSVYALCTFHPGQTPHPSPHGLPPNRMSPNTAVAFLLLAASLILMDKPSSRPGDDLRRARQWPFQVFAFAVMLDAVVALMGQLLGVTYLYGVTHSVGMAIPTASLFIVLGIGVLFARPDRGVMAVLTSSGVAAQSARRLLPAAVITPIVLGGVTLLVIRLQHTVSFFLAYLVVIAGLVVVAAMIWKTIIALHEQVELNERYSAQVARLEREKVESELEDTRERLQFAVSGAQLGTWHWDLLEGAVEWSSQFRKLFGLADGVKASLLVLRGAVHPDDWEMLEEARLRAISEHSDYAVEYRIVWPDGSVHWIASHGHGYYDDDGTPLRFEGIAQDVTEQREARARQQRFMRDMLASVTEAKLTLCLSPAELPPPRVRVGDPVPLLASGLGMRDLRYCALEACQAAGHAMERCYDLQTAVDEAAMNAVVHAGGGMGAVTATSDGTVQVRITDSGAGISLENLPRATLKKGFTTAGSMGHGMKIMLQTADRVYLLTGAGGTTIVMEQDKSVPEVSWL